ncbi:MAG: hypothetical protein O2798_02685 [Chloroflexi bacterium]|nr:hypothetical protein [Chloroflexota bacterium]MDA1239730.1 hypothetical protein [Chloroflexota bacterium]
MATAVYERHGVNARLEHGATRLYLRVTRAHHVGTGHAIGHDDVMPQATRLLLDGDLARALQAQACERHLRAGLECDRGAVPERDQRAAGGAGADARTLHQRGTIVHGAPHALYFLFHGAAKDRERGCCRGRGASAEHEHECDHGNRGRGRRNGDQAAEQPPEAKRREGHTRQLAAWALLRGLRDLGHEGGAALRCGRGHGCYLWQPVQCHRGAQDGLQRLALLRPAGEAHLQSGTPRGDVIDAAVHDLGEGEAVHYGNPPIVSISRRSAWSARICRPRIVTSLRPMMSPISRADFSIRNLSTSTLPVILREPFKSRTERVIHFGLQQQVLGLGLFGDIDPVQVGGGTAATEVINHLVVSHPIEPRSERQPAVFVARDCLPCLQEDLLRQVLRCVCVPSAVRQVADDLRLVPVIEQPERLRITMLRTIHVATNRLRFCVRPRRDGCRPCLHSIQRSAPLLRSVGRRRPLLAEPL